MTTMRGMLSSYRRNLATMTFKSRLMISMALTPKAEEARAHFKLGMIQAGRLYRSSMPVARHRCPRAIAKQNTSINRPEIDMATAH